MDEVDAIDLLRSNIALSNFLCPIQKTAVVIKYSKSLPRQIHEETENGTSAFLSVFCPK